jgi:hypothetical protein
MKAATQELCRKIADYVFGSTPNTRKIADEFFGGDLAKARRILRRMEGPDGLLYADKSEETYDRDQFATKQLPGTNIVWCSNDWHDDWSEACHERHFAEWAETGKVDWDKAARHPDHIAWLKSLNRYAGE